PVERMLLEISDWLRINGEAIYGTRPWKVVGEGPTQVVGGSFNDTKRQAFTGQDIRFTTKGSTLYAIALAWPGEQVVIKSLAGKPIKSVELLGHRGRLDSKDTPEGVQVKLPAKRPC